MTQKKNDLHEVINCNSIASLRNCCSVTSYENKTYVEDEKTDLFMSFSFQYYILSQEQRQTTFQIKRPLH
jgi:hypothetical protein